MEPSTLPDPTAFTSQQLTDELSRQVAGEDVLGVFLLLLYCHSNEVNRHNSIDNLTSLEVAISAPLRRLDLRILIIEVLLLHGADPDLALKNPLLMPPRSLSRVVREWKNGGFEEAHLAPELRSMSLEQVEAYIARHGLQPSVPTPPAAPQPNKLFRPEPSPPRRMSGSRSRSPQKHWRSTSSGSDHQSRRRRRSSPSRSRSTTPRRSSQHRLSTRRDDCVPERREVRPPSRSRQRHSPSPSPGHLRFASVSSPPTSHVLPRPSRPSIPIGPRYWLRVKNLPVSCGERFLWERLRRRAIEVGDIILYSNLRNPYNPYRYAVVGVYSEADLQAAIQQFARVEVDNRILEADEFRVGKTSTTHRRMAGGWSDAEHRYVGPQAQAARPPHPARPGLALLHLPSTTTPTDVRAFICRSVSFHAILSVSIGQVGPTAVARVDLTDEASARAAIEDLDGELLLGYAVCVVWRELDPTWLEAAISSAASIHQSAKRESLDRQRYAGVSPSTHSATPLYPQPPSITAALPLPAVSSDRSDGMTAHHDPLQSPHQESRRPCHSALPAPSFSSTTRSLALSSVDLANLTAPSDSPPVVNPTRRIDFPISFGAVEREEAAAASEANEREKAFPDDSERQRQFEVFLNAQTGETRDWYTDNLVDLLRLSREGGEFADKAHEAVANRTRKGSSRSGA